MKVSPSKSKANQKAKTQKVEVMPETSLIAIKPVPTDTSLPAPDTAPDTAPEKKKIIISTPVKKEREEHRSGSNPDQFFQAIGVIRGVVRIDTTGRMFVQISGQSIESSNPLHCSHSPKGILAYAKLRSYVEERPGKVMELAVYPKFTHFPGRDVPYQVGWKLVAFRVDDPSVPRNGAFAEMQAFEFKLAGQWQFIPVCRQAVISIFRNFTPKRLSFIKRTNPIMRVSFMRGCHVPLVWKNAPINAARFNPTLEASQQRKAMFVAIKATYNPEEKVFYFGAIAAMPASTTPRCFKASKEAKAEAMKLKKEIAKEREKEREKERKREKTQSGKKI